MIKSDFHSRFSNIFIRNDRKEVCRWTFNLKRRILFLPVVVFEVLIIISKYMLIIKPVNEIKISKIPARINPTFKYFVLPLSPASLALDCLQSKIINTRTSGCLYSLQLGAKFRSVAHRGGVKFPFNFYSFIPPPGSGEFCRLFI